jgi:hypothetical protein
MALASFLISCGLSKSFYPLNEFSLFSFVATFDAFPFDRLGLYYQL